MSQQIVVPLAAHSSFSLARGVLSPEALVEWAADQGCPAVGICDTGNFYGLVRFIKAARARDIKAVAGLHFTRGFGPGIMAWCLDRQGFYGLNTLASQLLGQSPDCIEDFVLAWFAEHGWAGLALAMSPGPWLDALQQVATAAPGAFSRQWLLVAAYHGQAFLSARRTARQSGLRAIALNPGFWRDETERGVVKVLRSIELRRPLSRLDESDLPPAGSCLVSSAEMTRWFSDCPEMLQTAQDLAMAAKTDELIATHTVFPAWRGMSETQVFTELQQRCQAAISWRYPVETGSASGNGPTLAEVAERLSYELDIIRRKGFASYFLVVDEIVAQAPRTCGRGSAAASIVAYLLGITHVEPLANKLFFERFLNDERRDPPDIDIDFPWDERARVLEWVFKHYPGRAAMVADHITFGSRSALRESALALGYPLAEVERFGQLWLSGQRDLIPPELRATARSLKNLPRHLGLHPGGVVVTPEPIHWYSHTQVSQAGWPVLAWEKDATEDAGLVKIDLLGNRSLAVLRDSLSMVNPQRQKAVEWGSADALVDPETRCLVERGQTLGVFYVESPATRQLLRKMGSADYEHLVVASSIIRPAANRYITEYVRRLHGGRWPPLHPLVEDVLADTLGIMVYQEDVSRVAIAVAGFSAGEADGLRKVLTRKDRELRLAAFWLRFQHGAAERGVGADIIQILWDMILSFDGYSFCKSHSASYALVSYKLAWIRTWYPLEFFTAVINNGGGFYSRQVYVNEVRRLGFPVYGPDVACSRVEASIQGGGLRLGLSQIGSLSSGFAQDLVDNRTQRGAFGNLDDFVVRLSPSPAELRLLIRSGALDVLAKPLTRPQIFWAYVGGPVTRQAGLFPSSLAVPKGIGDYGPATKLADERDFLGLVYSRHPLDIFLPRARRLRLRHNIEPFIDSRELAGRIGCRVSIAGTLVAEKEVYTKKADSMSFVSFEDTWGIFETVLFPESYRRLSIVLLDSYAFIIQGQVQEDNGALTIQVENLVVLNRRQGLYAR